MNRTDEIDEKGIRREGRQPAPAFPFYLSIRRGDWYEKEMGGNQFGSGNGFAMYGMFSTGVQVKGDISITDPAELKNLPDHYREQLSDRLLVNADIIVPEDATYHIYKAQLRKPEWKPGWICVMVTGWIKSGW